MIGLESSCRHQKPIRYKTKTNSSLVTRVFPRLMLVVRFYFEFSLVDDNVNFFLIGNCDHFGFAFLTLLKTALMQLQSESTD